MGISFKLFDSLPQEDRDLIISLYKHIRDCPECERSYRGLIEGSLEDDSESGRQAFSAESLRILKQNEKRLIELVS